MAKESPQKRRKRNESSASQAPTAAEFSDAMFSQTLKVGAVSSSVSGSLSSTDSVSARVGGSSDSVSAQVADVPMSAVQQMPAACSHGTYWQTLPGILAGILGKGSLTASDEDAHDGQRQRHGVTGVYTCCVDLPHAD